VTDLDPVLKTLGVGGALAAAAWAIYHKLRANAAGDRASIERSEAEASLYETLTQENTRLAMRLAETDAFIGSLKMDINSIRSRCDAEQAEAMDSIRRLSGRVDELTKAVAECQQRHMSRDELDEMGRTGQIERRKANQTPRGRRAPK
jgi:predicted RNase H-like nuclease (RuvC/YqgF family)